MIDAAQALGRRGRRHLRRRRQDQDRSTENLERFRRRLAADRPLRRRARHQDRDRELPDALASDEWPGGTNVAYSPAIWRRMFEVIPDDNFGLNLDPSHLIWQFIDYERAVYDFRDRIFHVHAKDMEIDRDGLYQDGTFSAGIGWQIPRLPGSGRGRWPRFVAALYAIGYDYVISIEHEDRAFEGDEELVKRGFLLARNMLQPLIV